MCYCIGIMLSMVLCIIYSELVIMMVIRNVVYRKMLVFFCWLWLVLICRNSISWVISCIMYSIMMEVSCSGWGISLVMIMLNDVLVSIRYSIRLVM